MKTLLTTLTCAALTVAASSLTPGGSETCGLAQDAAGDEAPRCGGALVACEPAAETVVELALCLDTSGSMDGLIDAARSKLWAIVNDLALAEPTPRLRVALLTFGNDGHEEADGWVNVDVAFTEDLDRVSQELFALTTNGGTEYVGRVLDAAHRRLDWSAGGEALQLVVVAGNESAEQDPELVNAEVVGGLIGDGILVNSVYCGGEGDDVALAWRDVALRADGRFACIDQDHGTVVLPTPYDDELARLSELVNATYVPYGDGGEAGAWNQRAQDSNALASAPSAAAERACTKGGALYRCSWDLLDAVAAGDVELAELEAEKLPEDWRALSAEARAARVKTLRADRERLQAQIRERGAERETWLVAERARLQLDDDRAFDRAVRQALRAQAAAKGLRLGGAEEVLEGAGSGETAGAGAAGPAEALGPATAQAASSPAPAPRQP